MLSPQEVRRFVTRSKSQALAGIGMMIFVGSAVWLISLLRGYTELDREGLGEICSIVLWFGGIAAAAVLFRICNELPVEIHLVDAFDMKHAGSSQGGYRRLCPTHLSDAQVFSWLEDDMGRTWTWLEGRRISRDLPRAKRLDAGVWWLAIPLGYGEFRVRIARASESQIEFYVGNYHTRLARWMRFSELGCAQVLAALLLAAERDGIVPRGTVNEGTAGTLDPVTLRIFGV